MSDRVISRSTPTTTKEREEETDPTGSEADGGRSTRRYGKIDADFRRTIPSHSEDNTDRIYTTPSGSEE